MKVKTNYIVVIIFLFIGMFNANAQSSDTQKTLPDLEIKLHNGTTANLNQFKGKVVLLDFWYRGCAPCLEAIPDIIKLQDEFKDDLIIIAINNKDIQQDVVDYIKYKKMNYPSSYQTGNNIPKLFNVQYYPTTILYDREGNLIKFDYGYRKGGIKSLRKAIKKALK
ncbi:TlpA family protein disulfide reductase [Flavobacterium hauense]